LVSKPVWIGIVIGVFFVGIGVSYAIFQANNQDEGILKTPAGDKISEQTKIKNDKIETTENQFSYDNEILFKIRQAQELSTNPKVLQALISSNEEFKEIDNVQVLIDELDANWVSTEPEELTPFMVELINNDISDLLREKIRFYDEEPGDLRSVEIILTNAYGANIAITGKTSDYRQDDETWWQEAKQIGLYLAPIDYDASADVYSADIALGIYDDVKFVGVLKIVVDIETIISMGS